MDPVEEGGQRLIRFTEHGQGRVSPFQQQVQWSMEAVWRADKVFRPLNINKTITTPDGAPLASEKKQFDLQNGRVRFERRSRGDSLRCHPTN